MQNVCHISTHVGDTDVSVKSMMLSAYFIFRGYGLDDEPDPELTAKILSGMEFDTGFVAPPSLAFLGGFFDLGFTGTYSPGHVTAMQLRDWWYAATEYIHDHQLIKTPQSTPDGYMYLLAGSAAIWVYLAHNMRSDLTHSMEVLPAILADFTYDHNYAGVTNA